MTDRDFLAELFQGLPETVVDAVLAMVMTVLVLIPLGQDDPEPGLSHLGGAPVMAAGIDWPRPGLQLQADEIASRAADDLRASLADHLRADVPLAFLAQIDLAALRQAGDAAAGLVADLPDAGRLLFFADPLIIPYHGGTAVGRVIWDQSAPLDAMPRALPPDLALAEARYLAETTVLLDRDSPHNQAMEDILRQAGLSESEIDAVFTRSETDVISPFRAPRQALAAEVTTLLPAIGTVEFDANAPADLRAAASAAYDPTANAQFADAYTEALWGWPEHDAPVLQLLGPPLPVQDDPRYTAVILRDYGRPYLDPEDWSREFPRLQAAIADWRLLLQLPLPALSPGWSEGMVYFLIHTEDLQGRRFDRVITVYQQT